MWLCPDGTSQSASCSTGKAPTQQEIVDLEDVINNELGSDVSKITYMSREEFFKNTFLKQYPNGVYEGRTLTASDMQDSLRLKLKDPTKYQVVSEVADRAHGRGGGCRPAADLRPGVRRGSTEPRRLRLCSPA